jgi:hypothetical protein
MKTILFIILFTALAYSQVTVQYTVTFDSASTTGSTVTLPRDLFLSGVVMPDSVSDSLYFQAYRVRTTDSTPDVTTMYVIGRQY